MTSLKRRLSLVGAPLVLALSLTACGGGGGGADDADEAPGDASQEQFCSAFSGLGDIVAASGDQGEAVDAARDFAADLEEVGTPEDLSDDQRAGFEAYVDFVGNIDDSDVEDLADADEDELFGDETDNVTAFIQYAVTTCPDALSGITGGQPDAPETSDAG